MLLFYFVSLLFFSSSFCRLTKLPRLSIYGIYTKYTYDSMYTVLIREISPRRDGRYGTVYIEHNISILLVYYDSIYIV